MGSLSFEHPLISCILPFSLLLLGVLNYTTTIVRLNSNFYNLLQFLFSLADLFSLRNPKKIFPFPILAILAMESPYFEDPGQFYYLKFSFCKFSSLHFQSQIIVFACIYIPFTVLLSSWIPLFFNPR